MTDFKIDSKKIKPIIVGSFIIGVIALITSAIGSINNPTDFFQSYLFSFLFWSDLPLGALPLVMIYPLTGGRWGASCRRILEALSDTILIVGVFSIPIFVKLKWIYPWMDAEVAADPVVLHKNLYLNPESFIERTVLYFFCWIVLNFFIKRFSDGSVRGASLESRARLRKLCAGGLVVYGFTVTFASVDWQMSVEPSWYSTIYGMVYAIGQALSAFAFALAVFGIVVRKKIKDAGNEIEIFPKKTLRDLGNILLTLVMVWAYLSFMQYLIVWSGNLPHEVIWYNHRTQGGWQWLALVLFLFQFSVPFIWLLFRASKDTVVRLAGIGALIFVVRIVDHYWLVRPGFVNHIDFPWETLTTWLGLGGIWLAVFLRKLAQRPLFAEQDHDWVVSSA